jgi:hypothetical protein
MAESTACRLALGLSVTLATVSAGCDTEAQNIPVLTLQQAESLPPSQVPRIFRDPDPYSYYPYNIHETDGLSRNPDDCVRWGCIDQNGR